MKHETDEERHDLVYRQEGHVTGVGPARVRRQRLPEPAGRPDPVRLSRLEIVKRIARRLLGTTVKVTPEQADARALEHISEAAVRLQRNAERANPPRTRGGLHRMLKRDSKIHGQ